ncbi:phosphatase PAP2 family protein [Nesterenkonia populi]|uniref:phosphatase PAP2 family protein n=1 Tax=Nesterenkonia populi TaxID=1591087 RepID=UPI0011BDA8F9|nr:phosphatase PAP2 family protein [Nesterenkonia populi]
MSSTLRPPARRTGLWIAGILVCCALLIGTYEIFVRTTLGQVVDTVPRLTAVHFEHPLPYLPREEGESFWTGLWILTPPAILFGLLVLTRQKFIAGLIALGSAAAANITTQVMKYGWMEREPVEDGRNVSAFLTQADLPNSLPSGHTTLAASAAVAVFLVASPRQRPFMGLLAAVWAGGWGTYIFIEDWHRPSDMIAAYLVVAAWGLIAGWAIMRADPNRNTVLIDNPPTAAPAAALCWVLGILFTASAGLSFLFGGGWSGLLDGAEDPTLWHWLAGALLSGGPAFMVAGAGISLFASEAGRRQRGVPSSSTQAEQIRYPIPENFAHLYRV